MLKNRFKSDFKMLNHRRPKIINYLQSEILLISAKTKRLHELTSIAETELNKSEIGAF